MKFLDTLLKKKDNTIAYQRLFDSIDGKKVLRDLMKGCHFFDTTFTGDATETAYREGERSVVLRILKILNLDPREFDKIMEGNQGVNHDDRERFSD